MRIPNMRTPDPKGQPQLTLALVSSLESGSAATVFAKARLRRQLRQEQVAQSSGITTEQVRWLEEGRVYAFRTPEDALAAAALLASGLEIDNYEARELAGLPVLPRSIQRNPRGRLAVVGALVIVSAAAAIMLGYALRGPAGQVLSLRNHGSALPAPWKTKVDVQNGSGDINYTRRVASRIAALGYQVVSVRRASRFDYKHTTVFYTDAGKGRALAERLSNSLGGVDVLPLPAGKDPLTIDVIVGPANLAVR